MGYLPLLMSARGRIDVGRIAESTGSFQLEDLLLVWRLAIAYIIVKPQGVIKDIFHIPLARLFLGAAKVFQPQTV